MCFTSQSISPIVFTLHIIGHRFRSPFFARDSRSPPSLVATHTCAHTHSETPIPSDLLPRIRRVSAVSSDDDDDRRSFVLSSFTVLLHYASSADTGSLCGRKSIALPRLLLLLDFSSCAAASTFNLLLHTLTLSLLFLSFAHSRVIPVPVHQDNPTENLLLLHVTFTQIVSLCFHFGTAPHGSSPLSFAPRHHSSGQSTIRLAPAAARRPDRSPCRMFHGPLARRHAQVKSTCPSDYFGGTLFRRRRSSRRRGQHTPLCTTFGATLNLLPTPPTPPLDSERLCWNVSFWPKPCTTSANPFRRRP